MNVPQESEEIYLWFDVSPPVTRYPYTITNVYNPAAESSIEADETLLYYNNDYSSLSISHHTISVIFQVPAREKIMNLHWNSVHYQGSLS